MPCYQCTKGNKKMWKLGEEGDCEYTSKAACERAYAAYLAKQHDKKDTKK